MRRADLKNWARNAMNRSYWKSVLVALIIYAIIYAVSYVASMGVSGLSLFAGINTDYMSNDEMTTVLVLMLFMLGIMVVFCIASFLIKIFLANPIEVGCQRFFCVGLYQNDPNLNEVGTGFKRNYKNVIKTMFFRDLFLTLWLMLALVIAWVVILGITVGMVYFLENSNINGVLAAVLSIFLFIMIYAIVIVAELPYLIKYYEYMMIPYILADNPDMPRKQVFALTEQMMKGDKWNLFVLQLSFIGWDLLSVCTCGILSILYVEPYRYYTLAAFYKTMQQKVERQMTMLQTQMQQSPSMHFEQPNNF